MPDCPVQTSRYLLGMRVAGLLFIAILILTSAARAEPVAPPGPAIEVGMLEARTHPDGRWYGENVYHFRIAGVTARALEGKTVTWTLHVKRKLSPWKSAKAWLMEKQLVKPRAPMRDVAFALLYRSLAKAQMQPGQHVAAFVATTEDGVEVYRGEVGFVLPATGPHAYRPDDFRR